MEITVKHGGKIEGVEIFGKSQVESTKCDIDDVFDLFCSIISITRIYGETKMVIDNHDGPETYSIKLVPETEV